jgi:NAD(P)-dependent dehydrogenase (short-subunit alcohol dehydrogenase family)
VCARITKEERMRSIEGRVVLMTGASRGIGRAMALAFGQAGASVAMDVLPGMTAGVSIFATPSPIEGSRVAEEDVGRLGIEPGAPNAYPSPP